MCLTLPPVIAGTTLLNYKPDKDIFFKESGSLSASLFWLKREEEVKHRIGTANDKTNFLKFPTL